MSSCAGGGGHDAWWLRLLALAALALLIAGCAGSRSVNPIPSQTVSSSSCPSHVPAFPTTSSSTQNEVAPTDPSAGRVCWYAGLNQAVAAGALVGEHIVANPGQLVAYLNAAPNYPNGNSGCPADDGSAAVALLAYAQRPVHSVDIRLEGCAGVAAPGSHYRYLTGAVLQLLGPVPAGTHANPDHTVRPSDPLAAGKLVGSKVQKVRCIQPGFFVDEGQIVTGTVERLVICGNTTPTHTVSLPQTSALFPQLMHALLAPISTIPLPASPPPESGGSFVARSTTRRRALCTPSQPLEPGSWRCQWTSVRTTRTTSLGFSLRRDDSCRACAPDVRRTNRAAPLVQVSGLTSVQRFELRHLI